MPATKRRARLAHLFLLHIVTWTGFVFATGFGPPVLTDRDHAPTRRLTTGDLAAWSQARQAPGLSAEAALLYDVDADLVLYAEDAELPLPPASLTKLMTSLLVLEQNGLEQAVTIQESDLVGGATMGLQAGAVLSVEDLLWGLLVPSGNDAAMALARHSAGSVEAFVARMNQRAAQLDLTATHFENPHGFDETGHLSSAVDLLELARRNLEYPLFRRIVATAETTVAGYPLRTTNQLLGVYPGADGVKTGTTMASGQSLVAGITRDGHQVLIVLLRSLNRYADARELHGLYLDSYLWLSGDPQQLSVLNRLYDAQGQLWFLQATGEPPAALTQRWVAPPLTAYRRLMRPPDGVPWQPGMTVGTLEWRLGDQLVGTQPLVLR